MVRARLPLLLIWAGAALSLSVVTTRVRDWFVMTDELLYERLAISVANGHSLLPRVRGELIRSLDQLYPLTIAPLFARGSVPHDLWNAHLLNAWLMTSACIPAYLLARRVTGSRLAGYGVAAASLVVPWMIYSSFLLTEVVAYPAFLWALLAIQRAAAVPSWRSDALALLAITVAFTARTQFLVLFGVLPLALLAVHGPRRAVAEHRVAAGFYGAAALAAAVFLAAGGRLTSLTVYGDQLEEGSLLPSGTPRAFAEHVAVLSLGLGILPFVVALAWLLANVARRPADPERRAFACVGTLTVLLVTLEVTSYDLRVGNFVHDRYLFYLVPLALLACVCALSDSRLPRRSLLLPAALVTAGFASGAQAAFTWSDAYGRLSTESPLSALFELVADAAHGVGAAGATLAVATVVLTALFALAGALLRRAHLAAMLLGILVVVLPAETIFVFSRLLRADGWASRPLTGREGDVLGWVDRAVGTRPDVTMVPFTVRESTFETQQLWRDLEFWNKSVAADAHYPTADAYRFTGSFFPKLALRLGTRSGAVSPSPTRYAAQSARETRFRLAGNVRALQQDVLLIDAGRDWRLDWLSRGLSPDGRARAETPVRVRVFAFRGQRRPLTRFLTVQAAAPGAATPIRFELRSNLATRRGAVAAATVTQTIPVCVAPGGFADARLSVGGTASLSNIAVADEAGPPCRA